MRYQFLTTSGEDVTSQYTRLEKALLVGDRHMRNRTVPTDVGPALAKLIEVKTQRAIQRKIESRKRGKP